MARLETLCPGGVVESVPFEKLTGRGKKTNWLEARENMRLAASLGIGKRTKMKCPKCGRKVTPSVAVCDDGCCFATKIPPHKPKEWWKK